MSPKILVDYRENKPYEFPGIDNMEESKLPVGDYTHEGFETIYAVERKTLDDLATSVGADRLRFENEIRRANGVAHRNDDDNPLPGTKPKYGSLSEFVVLVEAHPKQVYAYAGQKSAPTYYSNIYPNSIIGTVESWPDKYETLEFRWAGSRQDAMQETLRLLDKWYMEYGTDLG